MPPPTTGHVSADLGPALAQELNQLAAERLISRSALIRQLVVDALTGLGRINRTVSTPRGRTASRRLLDRSTP